MSNLPVKQREHLTDEQKEYVFELKMSGIKRTEIVNRFNEKFVPHDRRKPWTNDLFSAFFNAENHRKEYDQYIDGQTRNIQRIGLAPLPSRIKYLSDMAMAKETANRERLEALKLIGVEMRHLEDRNSASRTANIEVLVMQGFDAEDPLADNEYFVCAENMAIKLLEELGPDLLRQLEKMNRKEFDLANQITEQISKARNAGFLFAHDSDEEIIDVESEAV